MPTDVDYDDLDEMDYTDMEDFVQTIAYGRGPRHYGYPRRRMPYYGRGIYYGSGRYHRGYPYYHRRQYGRGGIGFGLGVYTYGVYPYGVGPIMYY